MPRPKPALPRDSTISFRATDQEKAWIDSARGVLSRSEYLRHLLHREHEDAPPFIHVDPIPGKTPEEAVDRVLGELGAGKPLHVLEAEHDAYQEGARAAIVMSGDHEQRFEVMRDRFQVVEEPPATQDDVEVRTSPSEEPLPVKRVRKPKKETPLPEPDDTPAVPPETTHLPPSSLGHRHRRKGTGEYQFIQGTRQERGECTECGLDLGFR